MSYKEQMIKALGSEQAFKEHMRALGSKGGTKSKPPRNHPTRFDNNKALAIKANKLSYAKRWGKVLDSSGGKRKIDTGS